MSTAAPSRRTSAPPDERFWQRYSPHHEFSLSSFSSFALHLLFIGMTALLCMIPFFNRVDAPMRLDSVAMAVGPGDNGGRPDGEVGKRGEGEGGENRGDVQNPPNEKLQFDERVPSQDLPPSSGPVIPPLPEPKEPDASRLIGQITIAVDGNRPPRKTTTEEVQDGIGKGEKPNTGNSPGPGGGKITSKPIPPMLRWRILFNTRDGKDYARQLKSLGATLAIELPDEAGKATVYRDLTAPAKGKVEEVKNVKQIWWIDSKAESVSALCEALEIKPVPDHVIAFFPEELEKQLRDLELKYAKGKTEEQITETFFELKNKGGGRYEPVVIKQR